MPITKVVYEGRPHYVCDECGRDSARKAVLQAITCPNKSSGSPAKKATATKPRQHDGRVAAKGDQTP